MTIQHSHRARVARDSRSSNVVAALVERGILPPTRRDDALAVVDEVLGGHVSADAPLKRRFAELAGYVGAAFVVSAAGVFFGTQWPTLSGGQRIWLLVGVAALLAAAGLAVAGVGAGLTAVRSGDQPVRRRLAGVLFVGAAASAAGAAGLHADRVVNDLYSPAPVMWGFGTFTILVLAGYLLTPTLVGQVALAAGLFATVPVAMDVVGDTEPVAFGLIVLAIGSGWLLLAERQVWREPEAARIVGCVLVLVGAQIPVFDYGDRWVGYLALFAVAAAAFAVYVARTAWAYLATGVVAVTLAVPQALLDWTDDSLGPAGVLLAAGVTLLAASLLGLRLRREVTEAP